MGEFIGLRGSTCILLVAVAEPVMSFDINQTPIIELIQFNQQKHEKCDGLEVSDLLSRLQPDCVNWINLDGLGNHPAIETIQKHFNLHSLFQEDVLDEQRPKAEDYDSYLFFTMKMLYRINKGAIEYEQISFILGHNYLITFQEKEGDYFDVLRDRIKRDLGRVRKRGADYLLYRLIDITIDRYYDVLETFGDQIDEIEDVLYEKPTPEEFKRIQQLRKELIFFRKATQPLRLAINKLIKEESELIEEETVPFFTDLYNRVLDVSESIEINYDLTSGLSDMYFQTQNNRLNEVIRILTIISTIFIPLTFIVGVYGMNFDYMPELAWKGGYFVVLGIMLLITIGMLMYFKYKKWF